MTCSMKLVSYRVVVVGIRIRGRSQRITGAGAAAGRGAGAPIGGIGVVEVAVGGDHVNKAVAIAVGQLRHGVTSS